MEAGDFMFLTISGTAILIAGIITAVIGASGAAIIASTDDERKAAEKKRLKDENKYLKQSIQYIDNIKSEIEKAYKALNESKKEFANGGHTLNGVPLANSEFNNCIQKLENAKKNAKQIKTDLEETFNENTAKINKL